MGRGAWRAQHGGAAAIAGAALLAAGAGMGPTAVTKRLTGFYAIPARATRTFNLPYPDALKYGNARYSGRVVVLAPKAGATGRTPDLKKLSILYAGSALGGSEYEVRARNDNRAGTAAVRVELIATTVEPLPHS
jgi:hypothetical protein